MTRLAPACERPVASALQDFNRKHFPLRQLPQRVTSAFTSCIPGVSAHGSSEESSPQASDPERPSAKTEHKPMAPDKPSQSNHRTGTSEALILARSCVPKSVRSSSHGFRRLVWGDGGCVQESPLTTQGGRFSGFERAVKFQDADVGSRVASLAVWQFVV